MKILLTGANGYIGERLLPVLLEHGHEVFAVVRDKRRLEQRRETEGLVHILEMDFLHENLSGRLPEDLDAAYYLIHSMKEGLDDFNVLESRAASPFPSGMSYNT